MINSLNQFQVKLQSDYSLILPVLLVDQISKLTTDFNVSYDNIFIAIKSALDGLSYSWNFGMPGRETPLLYCRKPNSFQSGDYSISKDEKFPNMYTAAVYLNSIKENILGHDTNINALKLRVEVYAKLTIIKKCISELSITF